MGHDELMLSFRQVRCFLSVCLTLSTANLFAAPPTIQQVERALNIAERAAETGLIDLSQKAVVRALAWGSPTVSEVADTYEIRISGARVDTSKPLPPTAADALRMRIPPLLKRLLHQWEQHSDSADIYATLKSVVLPQNRPGNAWFYSPQLRIDSLHPYRLPAAENIAGELVMHASRSQQLDALKQEFGKPAGQTTADWHLLAVMVGVALSDSVFADAHIGAFQEAIFRNAQRSTAEIAAVTGRNLAENGKAPDAAAKLLAIAAETIANLDQHAPLPNSAARAVLLEAARAQFAIGLDADGIRLLKLLRTLNVHGELSSPASEVFDERVRIIGQELYRRGLGAEARVLLGKTPASEVEAAYLSTELLGSLTHGNVKRPDLSDGSSRLRVITGTSVDVDANAKQVWIAALDTVKKESRVLFAFPTVQNISFLSVSPDGAELSFAATLPGEVVTSDSRIYVCRLSDGTSSCLGPGTMPSWSPGGRCLACCCYSPKRGVWVMRASGAGQRLIDANGWGPQWAPDGSCISYSKSGSGDIYCYDFAEDEYRRLIDVPESHESDLIGRIQWFGASDRLAFKTRVRGSNSEMCLLMATTDGHSSVREVFRSERYFGESVVWQNDGAGIIFSPRSARFRYETLHQITWSDSFLSGNAPQHDDIDEPEYIDGQFPGRINRGAAWMDDGRTLLYVSKPVTP